MKNFLKSKSLRVGVTIVTLVAFPLYTMDYFWGVKVQANNDKYLSLGNNVSNTIVTTNPSEKTSPVIQSGTVGESLLPPIVFNETDNSIIVNNWLHTMTFYKGTYGYNTISNTRDKILVYNEQWSLEYQQGSQWKPRGTPQSLSWQKIADDHYQVIRYYDDFIGTTWDVVYDIKSEQNTKITINIHSGSTAIYQLSWLIDGIAKTTYTNPNVNQVIYDEEIGFDWNDVYNSFGNITTYTEASSAQGRKLSVFFGVGNINSGDNLTVDPATVGTSTQPWATGNPYQHRIFYYNSLYWLFYSDGTNYVWRTSSDGTTWGDSNTYSSSYITPYNCMWWDDANSKACFARTNGGSANIYYRQGTLNADSSISWDSSEVQISTSASWEISLCKDSNGYPWVAYPTGLSTVSYKVVKATATNGSTWGSETELWSSSSSNGKGISIHPLTSGKMLAVLGATNAVLQSRTYNGVDTWASAINASSNNGDYAHSYSVVTDGDNAALVFQEATTHDVDFNYYNGSTWLGTDETVASSGDDAYHNCAIAKIDTGKYRVFYTTATQTISYIDRISGSWDESPTVISSSESAWGSHVSPTSVYSPVNDKLAVAYTSNTANPYSVRFALTDPPVSGTVETNPPSANTGAGWTDPTNAYDDDSDYAYITSGTPSASNTWGTYGFSIAGDITSVRVRYDAYSVGYAGSPTSYTRVPTSDISVSGWTKSTTYYYEMVDETSPGDGDYLIGTANGGYARFGSTISLPNGCTVSNVRLNFRAMDDSSGTNSMHASITVGGTNYDGSDVNPDGSSFTNYYTDWANNPKSGVAWTEADLEGTSGNALQNWGVEIPDANPDSRLSLIYLDITYTPATQYDDQIKVDVSWDGGSTWSDTHDTTLTGSQVTYWYDVTSATTWDSTKLNDSNLKVRALAYTVNNAEVVRLEYLPVEVTYTPSSFDISNTPSSKDFGIVAVSTTYYAKGSAPNNPVEDGDCTYTLTNNGDTACDIDAHVDDFTGGVGWNIGAPGENQARITIYYTGQNPASGLVLANTDQEVYDGLASTAHFHWDFKLETPTSVTDGVAKQTTLTLTAVAED